MRQCYLQKMPKVEVILKAYVTSEDGAFCASLLWLIS
jgi:hypothetical protein